MSSCSMAKHLRNLLIPMTLWMTILPAFCQQPCCVTPAASPANSHEPAILFNDLGRLHHPVSSTVAPAQRFFDQGLTLVYAFNFPEAYRSFLQASKLDPHLAMAYWGMAIALGPNYNEPADADIEKNAYPAAQKALGLKQFASPQEQAYIDALSQRFSSNPKADLKQLDRNYADAMRRVYQQYPDDLDAATLYAESLMELHPWKLWSSAGTPTAGTDEILTVLESVLRRNPNHLGANHFYIHAVEASPHPEWALPCADRIPALALGAGHIVHMPSHIYMRVGDYEAAASSNEAAIAADRAYFRRRPNRSMYQLYYAHNLSFLEAARSMEGRFRDAKYAADQTVSVLTPFIAQIPTLEAAMSAPDLELVRFHRWADILRLKEPHPKQPISHALWHYAAGMASAATGQTTQADDHLKALDAEAARIPADPADEDHVVGILFQIARTTLTARIARMHHASDDEITSLQKAVALQDTLPYGEPPDWYCPVREALGGALLRAGRNQEAERVFRDDLEKNPRSGRSLYGLMNSLEAEGRITEAHLVQTQFDLAWQHADTPLSVDDL